MENITLSLDLSFDERERERKKKGALPPAIYKSKMAFSFSNPQVRARRS